MRYPNFLVLGANKAGTTSLYRYLGQHPDVFVSPVKEPSYFTKGGTTAPDPATLGARARRPDPHVTRTLDEYLALFEGARGESAVGEASTAYLASPVAPERIRREIPGVKMVAVLRNPLDRAFSAYAMHVQWGMEERPFADLIDTELAGGVAQGRRTHYVATGCYGEQLPRYLDRFPQEQLRVYLYEDFQSDPAGVMRDLYGFLAVDESFEPDLTERRNVSRAPSRVDRLPAPVRRLRALVPAPVRRRVRARATAPLEFPESTRRQLVERFRTDIAETSRLIDRDLSVWLE